LNFIQNAPTTLYGDNMVALAIAQDPQYHARSKHFDVKSHYVREKICEHKIHEVYCPKKEMIANILTKPLPKPDHERLVQSLGMSPD
jgi:hypothetical protein